MTPFDKERGAIPTPREIARAWATCTDPDWMFWLLARIAPDDPRCRLAAADFAERAWSQLRDEPARLACAWAIDVARRDARGSVDIEECIAAIDAAYAAADCAYAAAAAAAADAAANAADAAANAANAAANAADAAANAAANAAADRLQERRAQADILRSHFRADEIARMAGGA